MKYTKMFEELSTLMDKRNISIKLERDNPTFGARIEVVGRKEPISEKTLKEIIKIANNNDAHINLKPFSVIEIN